jgi:hypothetical protein
MRRRGRRLERIVALIEKSLGPEGLLVKSPDVELDKTTGKPREIDVGIRLKGGSTPLLIMVECREHKRRQGVEWIEQVVSKRDGIRAAKALAASSSGFTESALEKARYHGVETRRIDEIDAEDVRDWFGAFQFTLLHRRCELHHAQLSLDLRGQELQDQTRLLAREWKYGDEIFICKPEKKKCSFAIIHKVAMNNDQVWPGIPIPEAKKRRTLVLNYPNEADRYQLQTTQGPVDISRIVLDVTQCVEEVAVPLSRILSYHSESEAVSQVVQYEFDVGSRRHTVSFAKDMETGQISLIVQGEGQSIEPESSTGEDDSTSG